MSLDNEYIEFDEIENVIDNLTMVVHFLNSSFEFKWKWVCIVLHQSLYGLMIMALQGNDPRHTIYDKSNDSGKAIALHAEGVNDDVIASCFGVSKKKVSDWITNPWLISFNEALKRVQRKKYLPFPNNVKPLTLSKEEEISIEKLSKEFRNEFEHFSPKRWAINISGFPKMTRNLLRVILFIALESNCLTLSNVQEKELSETIEKINDFINK